MGTPQKESSACSGTKKCSAAAGYDYTNGCSPLQEIMGWSKKIQSMAREIQRVAVTDFSVLIVGETGSGKEVVARNLHELNGRSSSPFIAVDCGSIPETLIESELFGHERGAFTGAYRTTPGKFEAASGGTIFLDEISNLPLAMQSKLLRALQDKRFYRVGGTTLVESDVRIIAATNRDLMSSVGVEAFRRDLYYRLAEYIIHVPSLRERKEDIPFLVQRFIELTNRGLGKEVKGISDVGLGSLMDYDWPGNVRELRNVVKKAVLLADDTIGPEHLDLPHTHPATIPVAADFEQEEIGRLSLKEIVRRHTFAVERAVIDEVLRKAGGNKAEVARILQVNYKTLHVKVRKYGMLRKGNGNGRR